MNRRKLVYVGVALITFVLGLVITSGFVFSPRTFKVVSQDGGGHGGTGYAASTWLSSDGLTVENLVVGYSSMEDARSNFDLERRRADHVIESSTGPTRLVARFGTSFKVITLGERQITYVRSSHLEASLAFEKSWLWPEWLR